MQLNDVNPYIRLAIHSVLTPYFHIKRRVIMDYELLYIESGVFDLIYDDRRYTCPAGSILLICPGIPHEFVLGSEAIKQPHIHFDVTYDDLSSKINICYLDWPQMTSAQRHMVRNNDFPGLHKNPRLTIQDPDKFLETFFKVIDSEDKSSLSCKANMLLLIETIIRDNRLNTSAEKAPSHGIAAIAKEYIDANFDTNFSLDDLSTLLSCSKFHLERSFREQYSCSVIAYRNQIRMQAALDLLKRKSISETGQTLGYSSIYAFSRAFKEYYGASPQNFKKSRIDSGRTSKSDT